MSYQKLIKTGMAKRGKMKIVDKVAFQQAQWLARAATNPGWSVGRPDTDWRKAMAALRRAYGL